MPPTKPLWREYAESLIFAVILAAVIMIFIAQSFRVDGVSMEPTFHDGERLLVDKVTYRFRPPARGEIIVFPYPANPREKFIKRIIGIAGDELEIRQGMLYINGQRIEEDYILGPMYQSFGPVVVPEGTVFAMGDNRNRSKDSRFADVGMIDVKSIVGRGLVVYWPVGKIGMVRAAPIQTQLE